jgi:uncharacterized membrane protein
MSFLHTFSLWLHLVSVAVWLGGIVFFLVVFGPAVHRLPPAESVRILNRGREAFQTLSWIAINLLLLTGVVNFVLRATASGADLGVVYYATLAVKLLLSAAMIFHHALQSFKYGPRIVSLTAGTGDDSIDAWPEPLLACWSKWFVLLKINATLGAIVLLLGVVLSWR